MAVEATKTTWQLYACASSMRLLKGWQRHMHSFGGKRCTTTNAIWQFVFVSVRSMLYSAPVN